MYFQLECHKNYFIQTKCNLTYCTGDRTWSQRSVLLLLVIVGWKESLAAESIKKLCTSP